MGLDANYPAVTINNPDGFVTVYNQDHVPIGALGPSPYHSSSTNVTCMLKAWDDAWWYRLLNPDGWSSPATAAYVSADQTHQLNDPIEHPIPVCKNVGCLRRAATGMTLAGLAAGAHWLWRRRRR